MCFWVHLGAERPTQCAVLQERRWKHSVAKAVATEAAKFDRSRLKQSPGVFGDEIRQSQGPPVQQVTTQSFLVSQVRSL